MYRGLEVYVDNTTWPVPPALPAYPSTFPTSSEQVDLSIPAVLLAIGLLTTPSHAVGVSLSEFWAWVRYLHAVSEEPDLRITSAFADLDAHQKTILSDDFGMGVPMYWLLDRLQLGPVCDGRYFIERLAATTGAATVQTSKRGPNKAPDFVAKDVHGVWHVIECKGTQSGRVYRERQLGNAGPPPTGGMAQKRTITFPAGHTGQKLACALTIGIQDGAEPSQLKVVDPPNDNEFAVVEDEMPFAEDAVFRATTAKGLRLAGFEATSAVMSAPGGRLPSSRPGTGRAEQIRQEIVEEKMARAAAELDARAERSLFRAMGARYRGRKVQLDLPVPVNIDGREMRSAEIRQGVNAKILGELARRPLIAEPLIESDVTWREAVGATKTQSDHFSAVLNVGSFFISQLFLKP